MSRLLTAAAAQLGPVDREEGRSGPVQRMIALVERACQRGAELVVFPELGLTPFFPRWYYEERDEADCWFETEFPSNALGPLIAAARKGQICMQLGYAELVYEPDDNGELQKKRYNTSVLLAPDGQIMLKYRKIHLPGHADFIATRSIQHLEKRYFDVGNLGFPVAQVPMGGLKGVNAGMLICNDRRWPEAWRVLGLQEAELVMIGYNTPVQNLDNQHFQPPHLKVFHSQLSVQAGCYQNSCFAVSTAKAGVEDGNEMFGSSIIVNPFGEIIAQTSTWGDELIVADCDLDLCKVNRASTFNFSVHRRPEFYGRIVEQVGSAPPTPWSREAQTDS